MKKEKDEKKKDVCDELIGLSDRAVGAGERSVERMIDRAKKKLEGSK
jgi:hypothetical protein